MAKPKPLKEPDQMDQGKTALIAGASGFIGGYCLKYLLENQEYAKVFALVRHPLPTSHPRLTQVETDFQNLREMKDFPGADDVFCCLGTPLHRIRNRPLLQRVDHDYPLTLAQRARRLGASRMAIVTSSGIGPRSLLYYCRLKSRLESSLRELSYLTLVVLRPSLLLGKPTPPRPVQQCIGALIRPFLFLFRGPLGPYRPVPAEAVGFAMATAALGDRQGFQELHSHQIHHIFEERQGFSNSPRPLLDRDI